MTTRPDVSAEQAGVLLGVAPSRLIPQEIERYRQMAQLVIDAGADRSLIERWRQVGDKRAVEAQAIPNTGRMISKAAS